MDNFIIQLFRYPDLAELAYGSDRRGCFENPDEMKAPASGIDCPVELLTREQHADTMMQHLQYKGNISKQ